MKKSVAIFAVLAITLGMTSCGSNEKKQEEDQKNLVEELKKEFGSRNDIVEVILWAGDPLNASLETYEVVYKKDNEILWQKYEPEKGLEEPKEPHSTTFYDKSKPLELKMFSLDSIQSDYNKCLTILKSEFTGEDELDDYTLYKWQARSNYKGILDVRFVVNATIKAESTHREGRNIVTNYYEFVFKKQDNGSMKLQE